MWPPFSFLIVMEMTTGWIVEGSKGVPLFPHGSRIVKKNAKKVAK
jgi:hypothetical protein